MKIAIKNLGNQIYIDKEICSRVNENGEKIFSEDELTKMPYSYSFVNVSDEFSDCEPCDFNKDLTFNEEKYNQRKIAIKEKFYAESVIDIIREHYSINDEIAILRQKDTKPDEFRTYYEFVENAKSRTKKKMTGGNL